MREHPVVVQLPVEVYEQMKRDLRVGKREFLQSRIETLTKVIEVLQEARVGTDPTNQAIAGLKVALQYTQKELDNL